jgi:phosphatidylglycerophosphatase A
MDKQTAVTRFPAQRTTWAWLVGTFFGAGLLRPGPGTYGSAAAALLWFAAARLLHPGATAMITGTLVAAMLATLIGIPAATIVARETGREDPGHVVIDEVAGQLIALVAMPQSAGWVVLAFLLFRLFDITKPPPVRQLERLPAGTGIMLDDLGAGLYALLLGHIVLDLFRHMH